MGPGVRWRKPPGQGYPHDILRPNGYTTPANVPTQVTSLSPGVCPHQLLKGLCSWGLAPLFPPSTLSASWAQPQAKPQKGDWTLSPSTASCRLWALAQRPGSGMRGWVPSLQEACLWEGTHWATPPVPAPSPAPCVALGNSSQHPPTPQPQPRAEARARDPQTPSWIPKLSTKPKHL